MKTQILFLMALLCAVVASVHSTQANTITVTNTNDGGPGSLAQAIALAHDGDTIDATGVSGTILLILGELQITHSVTINGPGAGNLVVDGNARFRVFENFASNVTISGLTITNGFTTDAVHGGGGILNHGGLRLNNSSVVNNVGGAYGGGISSSGAEKLTVTNSTISGNHSGDHGGGIAICCGEKLTVTSSVISNNHSAAGGGIHSDGAIATVSNSTIKGNVGAQGGGIFNNAATLTITNCTVSGNRGGGIFTSEATLTVSNCTISGNSGSNGGGIYNEAMGGFICNPQCMHFLGNSTVAISNSTLSGNSATVDGGAIYNFKGFFAIPSVSVQGCTISGNSAAGDGGGIYNEGGLELGSTILRAGSSGENIFNNGGGVTSHGYNLASDNGGGFLTGPGDQINTDPRLGPLQDNGGLTFTRALLPGSPAINAGDPNFTPPPFFDQRGPGYHRVVNGRIDIGSFEVQATPTPTPP